MKKEEVKENKILKYSFKKNVDEEGDRLMFLSNSAHHHIFCNLLKGQDQFEFSKICPSESFINIFEIIILFLN